MSSKRTHDQSSKRTRELMASVRVAKLADVTPGQPPRMEVGGAAVALARVGDQVFACGDTCAHKGGPLSGGRLTGTRLACPWHGWMYDVRTGACVERGISKAHALGFDVAIAVVDESGHLVICERMDGALWVTPEIARAKANAAAGFQATTLDLEERFNTGRQLFAGNVAALGDYEFVFGRGGVP